MANFLSEGNGYFGIQSTRPQTLSFALTDSPVGQLTWIIEKFKEWTGSDRDLLEDAIGLDTILTDVSLYWFTKTAGLAANIYYEAVHGQDWPTPSAVPTGVAVCRGHCHPPSCRAGQQRRPLERHRGRRPLCRARNTRPLGGRRTSVFRRPAPDDVADQFGGKSGHRYERRPPQSVLRHGGASPHRCTTRVMTTLSVGGPAGGMETSAGRGVYPGSRSSPLVMSVRPMRGGSVPGIRRVTSMPSGGGS